MSDQKEVAKYLELIPESEGYSWKEKFLLVNIEDSPAKFLMEGKLE